MSDILIKFIFNIIRIISNIFNPIIQTIANRLGISSQDLNLQAFFDSITTFVSSIAEGGVFMKRFLLIPNGILTAFFVWIIAKAISNKYFIIVPPFFIFWK